MSRLSSGKVALRICGRCAMSYPYNALKEDGQVKKLFVCNDCYDKIQPYQLPPLKPDAFILKDARPMLHLISWEYRNLPQFGGPYQYSSPEVPRVTTTLFEGLPVPTNWIDPAIRRDDLLASPPQPTEPPTEPEITLPWMTEED